MRERKTGEGNEQKNSKNRDGAEVEVGKILEGGEG